MFFFHLVIFFLPLRRDLALRLAHIESLCFSLRTNLRLDFKSWE